MRPDRTEGVAWFEVGAQRGFRGVRYYYAAFDGLRNPGLAYYDYEGARRDFSEAELAYSSYYQLPYDLAWPWDSITDEAVRQRVYDLYAPRDPENEPKLPEE